MRGFTFKYGVLNRCPGCGPNAPNEFLGLQKKKGNPERKAHPETTESSISEKQQMHVFINNTF